MHDYKNYEQKFIQTSSGKISYLETRDDGPVALFVHGVIVNAHLWRHQLDELAEIRRCIAIDLMGHGLTEISPEQSVSFQAQAVMLAEFIEEMNLDQVDLVANDSGVGIAQIFAAYYPHLLRSLTLTNGDVYNNWPPKEFSDFLEEVNNGNLPKILGGMLDDKSNYRSADALGGAYQYPETIPDHVINDYIAPHLSSPQRTDALVRFIQAFDNLQTTAIEAKLRELEVPTLIVWGTGDIFFDVKWAHWLEKNIPSVVALKYLEDARLLFPEERYEEFNELLRDFFLQQTTFF